MDSLPVNKVAESGIITLDLENYFPGEGTIIAFDIKPFLFKEMIVKEKDFRQALQEWDWSSLAYKHVAVTCSAEAIIPMWAYMLLASYLQPHAASMHYGTLPEVTRTLLLQAIQNIEQDKYKDQRVVIKGCGNKPLPEEAYLAITQKLRPVVKSLMYGEPCSTVPVYKKK